MAIYSVSITLPDGELDTITVEAPTVGAAQAEARSLAGLGSRIGTATEVERDSFRPTPDIDLKAQISRQNEINQLLDTIIEGNETPRQELIKTQTENRLADQMLTFAGLREGREERLMAVKAAEAMAKYRAYEKNFREANPDLPSELEVLGNELLPNNAEVATAVTNEVNARDLSDLEQSDIASINREAERQKARKLASLVTEDEIDEYNFGETVSNEKARQFTQSQQSDVDALLRGAGQQPQFGTTTDALAGLAENEIRLPQTTRIPGIDEGTDVGFSAGGGFDPGAMTSATTPGGSSFDEFIASLDPMAESESMSNVLGATGYGLPAFDPTQIDEGTGTIGDLTTAGGSFDPAALAEIDRLNAENAAMAAMMADMNQTSTDGTIGTGASITGDPALDVINDLIGGGDGIVTDGTIGTTGTTGTTGTGVQVTPTVQQGFGGYTSNQLGNLSARAEVDRAIRNIYGQNPNLGPIGGFLQSQAFDLQPTQVLGDIANIARGGPVGQATSFEDYLSSITASPLGPRGAYQQALDNLNLIRGLDADTAIQATPQLSTFRNILAPQTEADVSRAQPLLRAAQQARFSPLVRRYMATPQTADALFSDYILEGDRRARAGETPASFLDFAAGRYGL